MVHLNTVVTGMKCFKVICATEDVLVLYGGTEMMRDEHDSNRLNKGILTFFAGKRVMSPVWVWFGTVQTWAAWQMMLANKTLTHLINLIYWKIWTCKPFQLLIFSGNLAQGWEKVFGCYACLLLERAGIISGIAIIFIINKCGAMMSLRAERYFIYVWRNRCLGCSVTLRTKLSPKWDKLHPECPTLE